MDQINTDRGENPSAVFLAELPKGPRIGALFDDTIDPGHEMFV